MCSARGYGSSICFRVESSCYACSVCVLAVCCSVLQCVAVCCSELQCVAVCCSVLQCLQCVAVSASECKVVAMHVRCVCGCLSVRVFVCEKKYVRESERARERAKERV